MAIIDERHPRLARLAALWRSRCDGEALPRASALRPDGLADLAEDVVVLSASQDGGERLEILASGSGVDALYGEPLAGSPASRLASLTGDAEQEARSAIATARPLLIEDDMLISRRRRRVARLYLPLANEDGSPDGVLCGVVAVA